MLFLRLRNCKGIFSRTRTAQGLSVIAFLFFAHLSVAAERSVIATNEAVILSVANIVEIASPGAGWQQATQGQPVLFNYQIRTGRDSRAGLRLHGGTELQLGAESVLEILPPPAGAQAGFDLKGGVARLFSRLKSGTVFFRGLFIHGGIKGTEVVLGVGGNIFEVFSEDGEVELWRATDNFATNITSGNGLRFAATGNPIVISAANMVQWWLYYPAVLDLNDIALAEAEAAAIRESLDRYREGNVLAALRAYPVDRTPASGGERIYFAALLLSAGSVARAENLIQTLPMDASVARALRRLADAVNRRPARDSSTPASASEWLAASYYEQSSFSRDSLARALVAAREAVRLSPRFGFALSRVAELEFSHGRSETALSMLERSLSGSPSNATAHALEGFVLSARNRPREALAAFERAIALDGAFGHAWLGQGLCRIRLGDAARGQADLQTAVAHEANRSLLRSYLGKAFDNAGLNRLARLELQRARHLDTNDPTPWLYLGLLDQEENRLNAAVEDLERSLDLNDQRRVYRSQLLLDQDRAVRGALLAGVYRDSGLAALSVREASKSVDADYANYSAHYFLSDSYDALRDPKRINLRHETAWFSERLVADLLAPVGGANLSRQISEQEYSRLFEADRLGLSLATEVTSEGDYRLAGSQFGSVQRSGYSLDVDYRHLDGTRPNNDSTTFESYLRFKHQVTPDDLIYFFAKYGRLDAGDTRQLYDPDDAHPNYDFHETIEPLLLAGYRHEWSPNVHTLFLGGRLADEQKLTDSPVGRMALDFAAPRNAAGQIQALRANLIFTDLDYRMNFEIWSFELNQIAQTERQIVVAGVRFQDGVISAKNQFSGGTALPATPVTISGPNGESQEGDFVRASPYAYYTLKPWEQWLFTAGLTFDYLESPDNFRDAPVLAGESSQTKLSPKAAVTWTPSKPVTLRAVYSQSLGGVSYDESVRLEPTQLAGFNQAFRSIISESLVGSVAAPHYETWGLGFDWNPRSGTWLSVQGERLGTEVRRDVGVFDASLTSIVSPRLLRERLDYLEHSVVATFNQLLGEQWSAGLEYRFIHSDLEGEHPDVAPAVYADIDLDQTANLHQMGAQLRYFHPAGFFARTEGIWWVQNSSDLPDESVPQWNLAAGWRFRHNRALVTAGILNLLDRDYRLNPLTPHVDLPRDITFYLKLSVNF